jgi:hypothetical protein
MARAILADADYGPYLAVARALRLDDAQQEAVAAFLESKLARRPRLAPAPAPDPQEALRKRIETARDLRRPLTAILGQDGATQLIVGALARPADRPTLGVAGTRATVEPR